MLVNNQSKFTKLALLFLTKLCVLGKASLQLPVLQSLFYPAAFVHCLAVGLLLYPRVFSVSCLCGRAETFP